MSSGCSVPTRRPGRSWQQRQLPVLRPHRQLLDAFVRRHSPPAKPRADHGRIWFRRLSGGRRRRRGVRLRHQPLPGFTPGDRCDTCGACGGYRGQAQPYAESPSQWATTAQSNAQSYATSAAGYLLGKVGLPSSLASLASSQYSEGQSLATAAQLASSGNPTAAENAICDLCRGG